MDTKNITDIHLQTVGLCDISPLQVIYYGPYMTEECNCALRCTEESCCEYCTQMTDEDGNVVLWCADHFHCISYCAEEMLHYGVQLNEMLHMVSRGLKYYTMVSRGWKCYSMVCRGWKCYTIVCRG